MGIGFIVSMAVMIIWVIIILSIMIPYDKKYIVRENRKINYKKTTIYLRWNMFDTLTIILAVYTIICVQALNLLLSMGESIENPLVQFFTNQAQGWVIVIVCYFITRVSVTMKSIKAQLGEVGHEEQ